MNSIMEKLNCLKGQKNDEIWDEIEKRGIYVLSNRDAVYGAAGILNKELIKEFAGGSNFYVIPSSLHETIFMRADSWIDYKEVDKMITEINEVVLDTIRHVFAFDVSVVVAEFQFEVLDRVDISWKCRDHVKRKDVTCFAEIEQSISDNYFLFKNFFTGISY